MEKVQKTKCEAKKNFKEYLKYRKRRRIKRSKFFTLLYCYESDPMDFKK